MPFSARQGFFSLAFVEDLNNGSFRFSTTSDRIDANDAVIPLDSDFTVEGFFRYDPNARARGHILGQFEAAPGRILILHRGSPLHRLEVFIGGPTSGDNLSLVFESDLDNANADTFFHFALTRDTSTNTYTTFFNGEIKNSAVRTFALLDRKLEIGDTEDFGTREGLIGFMDEIRISNNVRYTGNYTVPDKQFRDDANTLMLLHCNDDEGDPLLVDDNSVTGRTAVTFTNIADSVTSNTSVQAF